MRWNLFPGSVFFFFFLVRYAVKQCFQVDAVACSTSAFCCEILCELLALVLGNTHSMSDHLALDGNKHYKGLDSFVWIELNDALQLEITHHKFSPPPIYIILQR